MDWNYYFLFNINLFYQTTDLRKAWTLPQNILRLAQSEAGDSSLDDICAHFLRKSMSKLNRIKGISCIVTYCIVGKGWFVIFFSLTFCPYGTIRSDRRWSLLRGSILTIPERDCCGCGAVMSLTRTNLNAKIRTKLWNKLKELFSVVTIICECFSVLIIFALN